MLSIGSSARNGLTAVGCVAEGSGGGGGGTGDVFEAGGSRSMWSSC